MTGRGWTRFLTRKQEEYLGNKAICTVREDQWSYMESLRNPERRGTIKGYYVLFGLTGETNSGHHIANYPLTEEGKAAAEECSKAVSKAVRFIMGHQHQKENPS